MAIVLRRRVVVRCIGVGAALLLVRWIFFAPSTEKRHQEIRQHGVLDLVQIGGAALDVQRHGFLQVRIGRDERPDIVDNYIRGGMEDYWTRFQQP
jgi:hypothetical protein